MTIPPSVAVRSQVCTPKEISENISDEEDGDNEIY